MSVDLTTCGSVQRDKSLPGMWADQTPNYADSFYNEATTNGVDSAGTIDFGVGVAAGTGDHTCKPVDSNSDKIVGISTRLPLMPGLPPNNVVGWQSKRMVGVAAFGHIAAIPCEAVTKDDQVLSIVAQGGKLAGLTNGAAGTGRLVVTGARWMETGAANVPNVIEVIGREAVRTSS